MTGKNLGNTTSSNTDPQTKGPTEGRRHEGGGARHKIKFRNGSIIENRRAVLAGFCTALSTHECHRR